MQSMYRWDRGLNHNALAHPSATSAGVDNVSASIYVLSSIEDVF